MTEGKDRDLVQRAEQALSSVSLREPDWDGLTSRIESAVGSPPPDDILLFAAPLPRTRDEGDLSPAVIVRADDALSMRAPLEGSDIATATSDAGPTISIAPGGSEAVDEVSSDAPAAPAAAALAEAEEIEAQSEPAASEEAPKSPREGVSLADLARATMARRRSSEAASIAKESLAVVSQSRAQGVEEAAQRILAATPASEKTAPRATPSIAEKRAAVARGSDLRGAWIGVAIAGIGLAAAFALVLTRPEAPAPLTVAEPAKVETQAPRIPATIAPPTAPAPIAPTPVQEATLDPSSLPTLPREPAAAAQTTAGGAAKSQPLAAAPVPAPTGVATGPIVAEKIVLDEDPKAAPKAAPAPSAPKPGDAKLRPAELSGSTMTDRPSAGAAQAAVGAVLGNARACVSGHPQPSTAQLVFGSDGQVQSVTVGGPAAGTPAAGCIEAALKKARVQPFAASSFSLGVTVRPP